MPSPRARRTIGVVRDAMKLDHLVIGRRVARLQRIYRNLAFLSNDFIVITQQAAASTTAIQQQNFNVPVFS
jgi:hypothetical protein